MKKTISWLLTLIFVLGLCPAISVNAAWDGTAATSLTGSGVSGDPYLISNAAELKLVSDLTAANAKNESKAHYKLTADIDLEGTEWVPISNGGAFEGNFDGDGHVVKNFKITTNRSANGFFFDMSDAKVVVSNLGIENATINVTSGSAYLAGVFAGRTAGKITNCFVRNSSVNAPSSLGTGAFAGGVRTAGDVYTNCYAYNVDVNTSRGTPGGFFSYKDTEGQTFENCYVANVRSNNASYYGFGLNISATVTNCYTTLADKGVTGTANVVNADKTAIVSGLVKSGSNYAVSGLENDGYPYLTTQKNAQVAPTQAPTPTPTPAPVLYGGGSGTAEDPYLIGTAQHLSAMNDAVNSDVVAAAASYKLTADIDFGGNEWLPLGRMLPVADGSAVTYTPAFRGTFDGDGHIVENIKITIPDRQNTTEITSYTGFFGKCENATIKNFGLDNMKIEFYNHDYKYAEGKTIRSGNAGVMAGGAIGTTFENCKVENSSVRNLQRDCGDKSVGGFVGEVASNNKFNNCYVYNTAICAGQNASMGGFFGYASASGTTMNNCFAAKVTHDVSGTSHNYAYTTTYGFGCSAGMTVTATDCYSTLADSQGNHFCEWCICQIYNKAYSVGKTAMTAEALSEAVLGKGTYMQDADVNDGYPYLSFGTLTPADSYAGGSGTEGDPFLISNARELMLASIDANTSLGMDYHFKLTADIDYGMNEWTPIGHNTKNADGTTPPAFIGGFDGNGHVIRNLKITNKQFSYHFRQVGFFGYISNATIKNLGIENMVAEVYNSNNPTTNERIDNMGGLAGMVAGSTSFTNCYIKNSSVIQMQRDMGESGAVGGFVGTVSRYDTGGVSYYPTFENCYVYNTQIASGQLRPMGGFFGRITYGGQGVTFKNCYAAEIDHAGAIAKSTHKTTTSTIYGFGTISGTNKQNGYAATLENCYSTLAGSTGNHRCSNCNAPSYDSTTAVGVEGATKDAIVTAFANTPMLVSDDINNGYPHFAREEESGFVIESVQPGITKVTAESYKGDDNRTHWTWQTEADDTVNVKVKRNPGETGEAKVYVASYDGDGRLISADATMVTNDTFSASVTVTGATTVKAFVWNDTFTPVAKEYLANPDGKGELKEVWTPTFDVSNERKTGLVLMGDSIVDNVYHTPVGAFARYGWEGYIAQYLTDDISLVKHGHGSQTVKDFIVGRTTYHYCEWASIKKQFGEGDYVILALGHNDEKAMDNGLDANKNFTVDEFKAWYKQIITDVKAKGAKIILLTPTPENGSHSNGQYYAQTYVSRTAILEVGAEENVPVIDMTQKFADKLNKLMADEGLTPAEVSTTNWNERSGLVFVDRLHMSEFGADLLAQTVAEEVAKLTTGLEAYVK